MRKAILSVLYAITIILLMFACKSSETSLERTKKIDTIETKSFDYVSQPIKTNYQVALECDSLGQVKPIKLDESSGDNKASIEVKNNVLDARLLTGLTRTKTDTIYKYKYENELSDNKIVRYKTPLWMWLTIIALVLVILLLLKFRI